MKKLVISRELRYAVVGLSSLIFNIEAARHHNNIVYAIISTGPTTIARDVVADRAGFCRALNIPARMVAGYT